jgi:hypothetical protein
MLGGSIKPPAFALSTIFDALEFIKLVGGMTANHGDAAGRYVYCWKCRGKKSGFAFIVGFENYKGIC